LNSSRVVFVSLAVTLLASCTTPLPDHVVAYREHIKMKDSTVAIESDSSRPSKVTIHYLGVGGFAFEVAGKRLITAPFYSNPTIAEIFPGRKLDVDEGRIEPLFPKFLRDGAGNTSENVKAILVGHSHYDHLLDVPYLMKNYLKEATVYGSLTTTAIVNKQLGKHCEDVQRARTVSAYKYVNIKGLPVRILPIPSSHAPHAPGGITVMKGSYDCEEPFDIRTAWDWKMGKVFAYLIDFLDEQERVVFRAFYQDSASDDGDVVIPTCVLKEKNVDVALLVMAGSSRVKNYPGSIVDQVKASLYLVGHWEDFFTKQVNPPLVAFGTSEEKFIAELGRELKPYQSAKLRLLKPGVGITIDLSVGSP